MRRAAGRDRAGGERDSSEKQTDNDDDDRIHHRNAVKLALQNLIQQVGSKHTQEDPKAKQHEAFVKDQRKNPGRRAAESDPNPDFAESLRDKKSEKTVNSDRGQKQCQRSSENVVF